MSQTQRRIIRKPEKRALTGLSESTTERLEKRGEFPERIHLTGGHVGWWLDEVLAWLEQRPRGSARSTAAALAGRQAKRRRTEAGADVLTSCQRAG